MENFHSNWVKFFMAYHYELSFFCDTLYIIRFGKLSQQLSEILYGISLWIIIFLVHPVYHQIWKTFIAIEWNSLWHIIMNYNFFGTPCISSDLENFHSNWVKFFMAYHYELFFGTPCISSDLENFYSNWIKFFMAYNYELVQESWSCGNEVLLVQTRSQLGNKLMTASRMKSSVGDLFFLVERDFYEKFGAGLGTLSAP